MSSPNFLSRSSLEILENNGNHTLNNVDGRLDDTEESSYPENVSLPESVESGMIRPQIDHRLDRKSTTSSDCSTTKTVRYTDNEPLTTHQRQIQMVSSNIRDAFRSGVVDVESILPDSFETLDEIGCNLLHIAVDCAPSNTVNFLLQNDIDLEARDTMGQTALHHAIIRADTYIMQLLLERGANIEAISNDGSKPLWMAANLGTENAARYLIGFDADLESFNATKGTTALFEAVKLGAVPIVRILLENGADVDTRSVPPRPLPYSFHRWQRTESQAFEPDIAHISFRRKKLYAATLAWIARGLGPKPTHLQNEKARRTKQWIGGNDQSGSSDLSHEIILESIDIAPGLHTYPPPPGDSPPRPTTIKQHSPKLGQGDTTWRRGRSADKPGGKVSNDDQGARRTLHSEESDTSDDRLKREIRLERKPNPRLPMRQQKDERPGIQPLRIRFKDCVGRNFKVPLESVKAWNVSYTLLHIAYTSPLLICIVDIQDMQKFIKSIFEVPGLDFLRVPIMKRCYDLLGPSNEILLPENWSLTIQPDWTIIMVLWTIDYPGMETAAETLGRLNVATGSGPSAGVPSSEPITSSPPQHDTLEQTPLQEAVLRGHKDIVELLLR